MCDFETDLDFELTGELGEYDDKDYNDLDGDEHNFGLNFNEEQTNENANITQQQEVKDTLLEIKKSEENEITNLIKEEHEEGLEASFNDEFDDLDDLDDVNDVVLEYSDHRTDESQKNTTIVNFSDNSNTNEEKNESKQNNDLEDMTVKNDGHTIDNEEHEDAYNYNYSEYSDGFDDKKELEEELKEYEEEEEEDIEYKKKIREAAQLSLSDHIDNFPVERKSSAILFPISNGEGPLYSGLPNDLNSHNRNGTKSNYIQMDNNSQNNAKFKFNNYDQTSHSSKENINTFNNNNINFQSNFLNNSNDLITNDQDCIIPEKPYVLLTYNNVQYNIFTDHPEKDSSKFTPEPLFHNQNSLFSENLVNFMEQLQSHFNIKNDIILYFPVLQFKFYTNMKYTKVCLF